MLPRMDGLVGVSRDVADSLAKEFRLERGRIIAIENGVDMHDFETSDPKLRAEVRLELGIPLGAKVIGTIGNLKRVKNHEYLVAAFRSILNDVPNARLLLVGKGFAGDEDNTETELRHYVECHQLGDKVSFLGYRADVARILSATDVFCLPSLREGLPISLIEAMATGLAVVATDVQGTRELVRDGMNGLLVPLDAVAALGGALKRILLDRAFREQLGRRAQVWVGERYSMANCVRRYERLIEETVSGRTKLTDRRRESET